MAHGTLRASPAFPPSAFLVEVGTPGAPCDNWGDSCVEDVSLSDLFLDGGGVAHGELRFRAVIGVNAGPDIYAVNWTTTGVQLDGGHEVLLHESWVGACWYTPPDACWLNATALNGTTGILVNGADHYLTDVIVFAGETGVAVRGAANLLTGVHTWNTQSGSLPSAVGILVDVWQKRLVGPYLDYVPLVLAGAALTTVTGAFFLGGAQLLFRPHPSGYPVQGVYVSGSQYVGSGGVPDVVALPPVGSAPDYSALVDVKIEAALSDDDSMPRRSSTASLTVHDAAQGMACPESALGPPCWAFEFAPLLVWTASALPIQSVAFSVWNVYPLGGSSGATFSAYAVGSTVAVYAVWSFDPPPSVNLTASITVSVDQSQRPAGGAAGRRAGRGAVP